MKIGFIGVGVVGGATKQIIERAHEVFPYDKYKEPYNTEENLRFLAENSEIIFLCVPTPMKPSGEIDYSPVHNSMEQLTQAVEKCGRNPQDILIVIRSTAVSGTTDKLTEKFKFRIAFNPEFLTEENAVQDMENTDYVVIGTSTLEDFQKVQQVYFPIFPYARYINVDRKTAEMIKYCNNVFLVGQVSLANELYQVCKYVGVDYQIVKKVVELDKRIGTHLRVPGPDGDFGFGGKCLPKDLNALIYLARENMYRPYLLEEMWRSNERVRSDKNWLNIAGATSDNQDFNKENLRFKSIG